MRMALVVMFAVISSGTIRAQDSTSATPSPHAREASVVAADSFYRHPGVARVLGTLIPGAGHFYAGEYLRGYGVYFGSITTIAVGVLLLTADSCTFTQVLSFFVSSCEPRPVWPMRLVGASLVSLGAILWTRHAIDAPRAAERANARHRRRQAAITPVLRSRSGRGGGAEFGLNISW